MNSINASASLPLESDEFERDDELLTSEPSRPASKYPAALVTRPISSSLKAAALAFVSSVCPNWSLVNSNVNRHWHCSLLFPLIAYPDTFSVVSSASRSSYLSGQLLNSPCSMSLSCTWDDNSLKLSTAFVCRDIDFASHIWYMKLNRTHPFTNHLLNPTFLSISSRIDLAVPPSNQYQSPFFVYSSLLFI